ncbi:MAG: hypothetical protein ABJN77_08685 [Lentilitoribacter sp.]
MKNAILLIIATLLLPILVVKAYAHMSEARSNFCFPQIEQHHPLYSNDQRVFKESTREDIALILVGFLKANNKMQWTIFYPC